MKAFFDGNWKILRMDPPFGSGHGELFNLAEDPGKLVDRSEENPDRRDKMIALWDQYQKDNGVMEITAPHPETE